MSKLPAMSNSTTQLSKLSQTWIKFTQKIKFYLEKSDGDKSGDLRGQLA